MNERLKELADKSGFGPAWYDPTIPTSDIDRRWMDQRRLKEFAELIVRECCFVGEQYAEGLFDMKHYDFVNKKIKEHFGVE
jgi:hypothetical protein